MDTTATAVYDAARLSLGDLFNAQAAQATYQRLVDVINAQAAAVERLAKRVVSLETTHRHAVAAQQHALRHMNVAVGQLERLQRSQSDMRDSQRRDVAKMEAMMTASEAKANQLVDERVARLEYEWQRSDQALRAEMAPIDLVARLQDDQLALHDRIATVETRVDGKLEKSELTRLDGAVAKIQTFAPTASGLLTRVGELEQLQSLALQQADDQSQQAKRIIDELKRIQTTLESKVERDIYQDFVANEFKTSTERLREAGATTQVTVDELVHRGVSLETNYRTLSSKLSSVAAAVASELDLYRGQVKDDLGKKIDHAEMDVVIQEMRHELSCKAWRKDTQTMNHELSDLKIKCGNMERQVELSTRFLNWFAKRGESYERNLDVVEQQLERLAHASAPQYREPYDDQVRF